MTTDCSTYATSGAGRLECQYRTAQRDAGSKEIAYVLDAVFGAWSVDVEGRADLAEERRNWRAALPAALVIFDADMV